MMYSERKRSADQNPSDRIIRHRRGWATVYSIDDISNDHQRRWVRKTSNHICNAPIKSTNSIRLPFRIIPPFFADKFGALNTIGPILFGVALVSWTWLAVHSVGGFYAFTAFYGIINGAFQCLIPTCVASLTPNLNMVGTRLGMAFATVSFAALTGP
jgi:hypothetical protein